MKIIFIVSEYISDKKEEPIIHIPIDWDGPAVPVKGDFVELAHPELKIQNEDGILIVTDRYFDLPNNTLKIHVSDHMLALKYKLI